MSHDHDEKDAKGESGRAGFEAHLDAENIPVERDANGEYAWNDARQRWNAWQAARADTARIVAQAEVERLKAEVSRLKGFKKQVTALLAERRELLARQVSEWRPIDSAPKDVLILVGPTKRMGICAAMNHSIDGWVTETCSEWANIYTPTHWMPLPEAPSPTATD